jgi:formate hydrogenlyase subunit 3/multisubunit Na+/H+ antiporter MnhD subunit
VDGPVLTLLTAIIAALLALGVLGGAWPRCARESVGYGAAGLAGLAAVLALVVLLLDDAPAVLDVPLGLPGAAFRLGLDPLAALFAVLVFAVGAAICAFAAATNGQPAAPDDPPDPIQPFSAATAQAPAIIAPIPICLAGLGLAVLAADSLARGTGIALAGVAIWALHPSGRMRATNGDVDRRTPRDVDRRAPRDVDRRTPRDADRRTPREVDRRAPNGKDRRSRPDSAAATQLGVALLAAAAIIAGAGAPSPAPLLAALLGPGALAGLVPLHAWLAPAHRGSTSAAALLSGGMVPVATYAILRMLFDPAGPAPPIWWGLPLLALGAASVVAGGFDATRRGEIDTTLAAGTVRQTGLIAIGLGVALIARAADLPGVTALALAATLLLATLQALCGTLLALAAGAIRHGAGTRRLDRLGGLVHRMPITTACLLAGLFGVAALPPGPGFGAIWLLFQALLALPRAGGLPFQIVLCAMAVVLGLAAALASANLLRVLGVVCLGRPRTPRAAAADEPMRSARRPLLALAVTTVVLGVFVGPLLRVLTDAPILALIGTGLGPRASLLGLAPGAESAGYAALPLTSLLLLAAGVVVWLRRRGGVPSHTMSGPAWQDGFAAPPAWLPFGNPITQTAGAGFAPVRTPPSIGDVGAVPGAIDATVSVTNGAGPVINPISPVTNATAPLNNATAPLNNATAPAINATAPLNNPISPIKNATPPVTNATASIANATAPVTNATTPVTNATTPVINATPSVTNSTAPVTNATAPVINRITSLTSPTAPVINRITSLTSPTAPVNTTAPFSHPTRPTTNATAPVIPEQAATHPTLVAAFTGTTGQTAAIAGDTARLIRLSPWIVRILHRLASPAVMAPGGPTVVLILAAALLALCAWVGVT